MKTEMAPFALGGTAIDPATIVVGAIVLAVLGAFALGAKRETAMFAVFAGVIGVILSV